MAFAYLEPNNLKDRYTKAKTYTDSLTTPFIEFERIARNRPHPKIDKAYPKTTDGTTASIIRKTPHRVIQQLPSGKVTSDKNDWMTIVASFIFQNKIIPYANEEYALIQKCWNVVEKSLTFGFCATYSPFLMRNGNFLTDLTIPYWGDIFLQPGKKSDLNSNYIFMRSWWRKEDIEALIDKESKLAASSKKRKEKYQSTWDIDALNEIKDMSGSKDSRAMPPVERERGSNQNGGIELITGFQRGVGAKFYTFHGPSGKVVRTKVNKDPRGEVPIQFMYGDIDGTNPLGRGLVELVGGLQNLMDAEMQMYQYNRALMLNPPLIKRGSFNKNKVKFQPNVVIDVGSDKDATVEPLKIDSTALANFPNNYGLMKSQLINLLASPDTSISAQVGNPGFSKTPQGVQQVQQNISVDDNYVEKQFEAWFERWGETAINLYFAERSGIEELQLDPDTAAKLRDLDTFDNSLLSDDNIIRIDFGNPTEALQFKVDPSTSSVKDSMMQTESATNILDLVMKYPMLNARFGGPIDVDVLARRIVVLSSLENPEQVAPEPTEQQKQAKKEAQQQVSPFSPMFDKPSIRINYDEIPPTAQLDFLKNAGSTSVTLEDVLAGPVVDPNARGTINPIDDPNMLVPGGGPAQQSSAAQAPQTANPLAQDGVNLTPQEIQRLSQDPRFAAAQPQEQQPQVNQYSPEDQQFIAELQKAGVPDDKIGQALAMLHHGIDPQQILQTIGGQ